MDELQSLFSRLRVQSTMFGNKLDALPEELTLKELAPSYTFHTLSDARDMSFKILNASITLIHETAGAKYKNETSVENVFEQMKIETQLREWRRAVDVFLKEKETSMTAMDVKAASMLKTHNLTCFLWVTSCLNPEETQFDGFTKEFEEILQLSATVSDIPWDYLCTSVGRFQFDMGLLPVLHYVGVHCRWPHIRKEALRILASARWREGLFDSYKSYRYIRKIKELENIATQQLLGITPAEADDYLPPEAARVHFSDIGDRTSGSETQSYMIFSKPHGVYGDWAMQKVVISASSKNPEKDVCDGERYSDGVLLPVPKEIDERLFIDTTKRVV